jgi:hypothetical protein
MFQQKVQERFYHDRNLITKKNHQACKPHRQRLNNLMLLMLQRLKGHEQVGQQNNNKMKECFSLDQYNIMNC